MSKKAKTDLLEELVAKVAKPSRQETVKTASQPEGMARITVRLPRELHRALKVYAAENDTTVQDVVVELLSGFVQKHKA